MFRGVHYVSLLKVCQTRKRKEKNIQKKEDKRRIEFLLVSIKVKKKKTHI